MVQTRSQKRKKDEKKKKQHDAKMNTSKVLMIYVVLFFITVKSFRDLQTDHISIQVVWSFAWITAVSTGIGSIPFFLTGKIENVWLHLSNTFAAGMMIAASINLVCEGIYVTEHAEEMEYITRHGCCGVIGGCVLGCTFMFFAKSFLEKYDDLHIYDIEGNDARRMLLIVFVMTMHSFSEGIAIGVAFAGKSGFKLGTITSTSLAVHNIPEGLAVSLALVPNGIAASVAGLWSVVSSLPQPLMGVVAYVFVEQFTFLLPIGLGFAAGAMVWVAYFELIKEALESISLLQVSFTTMIAAVCMMSFQHIVETQL